MSLMGQARNTEEGLQDVDKVVAQYRHGCLWWLSPWLPILRLFHPDTLRPVLMASGNPRYGGTWGTPTYGSPRATPECHLWLMW